MSLKHITLPQELGLDCKDIEIPSIKDLASYLQYALRFKTVGEFKNYGNYYRNAPKFIKWNVDEKLH